MSGGAGSRLWPVSRKSLPKQFHALLGEDTLFVETLKRVTGQMFNPPVIVSNNDHRFLVAESLRQAGIQEGRILLEPEMKDTAPALIAAAQFIAQETPDALILALPCDHNIKNPEAFLAGVQVAASAARDGYLVTFGISPDKPETGYGYIHQGVALNKTQNIYKVKRFVEKPNQKTAEEYLSAGSYLWNSGMFLFKAEAFLLEVTEYNHEMISLCAASIKNATSDLTFTKLSENEFCEINGTSIDYALWEKTDKAVTVPINCGWSDIGSWNSLADLQESDHNGNIFDDHVVALDSKNNFVKTDGILVTLLGLENLIVVANDDALLISHKDQTQNIKKLVEQVKIEKFVQSVEHPRVHRPWGWYETIESGKRHKVKLICVKVGGSLSLQKHYHRSEHWVVVSGTATVTNGENFFDLIENQSTYIPAGIIHRLENKGRIPLTIVEVQTGSYLEEDDIVRMDDIYNR